MKHADPDLTLMLGAAQLQHMTLVTAIETVAMELHQKMSPTDWINLTTEQRNSTRRRSIGLLNEALEFWDREVRKMKEPLT